jgi:hypothetical protein
MSNLTSSEWASWVQAIGAIAAIFGAAAIARYQTERQYKNDLEVQRLEQEVQRAEVAKTLSALAENSSKAMAFLSSQLPDRESVHRAAEGLIPCAIGEIERLDTYIGAIPLHELPHSLVAKTLILGSTVRQFKEKVQMTLRLHRHMDGSQFDEFFGTVQQMNASAKATCKEICDQVQGHAT